MINLKKIHLQKREYAMIFTCIGLLLVFPIYGIVENPNSHNDFSYAYALLMMNGSILIGYGWLMPLITLLANIMIISSGESLSEFPSSDYTKYLPWILPTLSTILIIKFSTGIPTWRTILYAHIIASAIGTFAIFIFWPTFGQ